MGVQILDISQLAQALAADPMRITIDELFPMKSVAHDAYNERAKAQYKEKKELGVLGGRLRAGHKSVFFTLVQLMKKEMRRLIHINPKLYDTYVGNGTFPVATNIGQIKAMSDDNICRQTVMSRLSMLQDAGAIKSYRRISNGYRVLINADWCGKQDNGLIAQFKTPQKQSNSVKNSSTENQALTNGDVKNLDGSLYLKNSAYKNHNNKCLTSDCVTNENGLSETTNKNGAGEKREHPDAKQMPQAESGKKSEQSEKKILRNSANELTRLSQMLWTQCESTIFKNFRREIFPNEHKAAIEQMRLHLLRLRKDSESNAEAYHQISKALSIAFRYMEKSGFEQRYKPSTYLSLEKDDKGEYKMQTACLRVVIDNWLPESERLLKRRIENNTQLQQWQLCQIKIDRLISLLTGRFNQDLVTIGAMRYEVTNAKKTLEKILKRATALAPATKTKLMQSFIDRVLFTKNI